MTRRSLFHIPLYGFLLIAVLVVFMPFYWMFSSSIKPMSEIFTAKISWIPSQFVFANYSSLFTTTPFLRWMFNSVFVSSSSTFLGLFLSSLAGFAFAKYDFWGKNFLFLMVLASLSIPIFVTIIPVFGWMVKLHLIDTYWVLILPFAANAIAVFFMRQYIKGIPSEILDSARIDGCSEFKIYYRIILPLIKPALGACGIIIFMRSWNDYLYPLVMMRTQKMMIVPVGLASFKAMEGFEIDWGMIMSGAALSCLPMIIIFLLMQKRFIAGLTAGSIKG